MAWGPSWRTSGLRWGMATMSEAWLDESIEREVMRGMWSRILDLRSAIDAAARDSLKGCGSHDGATPFTTLAHDRKLCRAMIELALDDKFVHADWNGGPEEPIDTARFPANAVAGFRQQLREELLRFASARCEPKDLQARTK